MKKALGFFVACVVMMKLHKFLFGFSFFEKLSMQVIHIRRNYYYQWGSMLIS